MNPIVRSLTIESFAGRVLHADLHLPSSPKGPPVVLAHGFLGFKDWAFFPWLADFLAREGFPVLRFNFSGSGMGEARDGPFRDLEAFRRDTVSRQVEDLQAVRTCWVNGGLGEDVPRFPRVFLFGHSRGAAVAVLAASRDPTVAALAAWAPVSRLDRYDVDTKTAWRRKGVFAVTSARTGQTLHCGLEYLEDAEKWAREGDVPVHLHRLEMPILLVHGAEDTTVPPAEAEALASVNPRVRLAVLAGADHKFGAEHPLRRPGPVLLQAAERTADFFREASRG